MTFLLVVTSLVNGVVGEELRIRSVDGFIQFSKDVNNGMNYSGTTVFLGSNIDFTGETFESIEISDSNYFNGTFDGKGHVISNLNVTSPPDLLGYSGSQKGLPSVISSSLLFLFHNKFSQ